MTAVVVNDPSCLIDLRKGRLVPAMLTLPYRFVVPLPVRQSEALDFGDQDRRCWEAGSLVTFDLPPERVAEAIRVKATHPRLSAKDCFCLVATQCHEHGILLTGDRLLHRAAVGEGVRVHGVLWVVDELRKADACDRGTLITALESWRDDRTVFLPRGEIGVRLRELRHGGPDHAT